MLSKRGSNGVKIPNKRTLIKFKGFDYWNYVLLYSLMDFLAELFA
jgi:hypothetical protein